MGKRPTTSEFNPLYEETFDNTHQVYEDMRKRCPVAHSENFGGFWALFKYEDIVRIQEDSNTFTVAEQNVVPRVTRTGGRRPPLHYDPPEHDIFRKPINRVFRKSRMDAIEPTLAKIADELLDPLVARGTLDFSKEFAEFFAAQAFGQILKLPLDMMLRAREVGVRYYRATTAMDRPAIEKSSADLYAVAQEVVEGRRADLKDPKEDLISALLLAKHGKDPMPVQLVIASIRQFLSAAQAAPQAVLGSACVHLARDKALQDKLRKSPTLIPKAVEEFLRMYAPYRVFARTAVRDVEIRGRVIKAGEPIAMMFPSANRDEDVFSRPHEFDMNRMPNKHIAFGRGAHQCPAAALARLELKVGLRSLLSKTRSVELAGPVKMSDWLEFGPSSTPIRVVAAAQE
jgi:cytochrome P450